MGCCRAFAYVVVVLAAFLTAVTHRYAAKSPKEWDEFLHYHRPFPLNTINGVHKFIQEFIYAPGLVHFDPDALEAAAISRAGLDDFGSPTYRAGLEQLTAAANGDSRLTLMGALVMREAITNYLHRRLQIVNHAKEHPELQELKVEKPIFIVGLPRTGTTLLQSMLSSEINELRAPLQWELYAPFPVPQADDELNKAQIAEAEFVTNGALSLIPNMARMHPEFTFDASEDIHIQAFEFNTRLFAAFMRAPDYLRWIFNSSVDLAYVMAWHETFVRHLMSDEGRHQGRRWLFKAPRYLMMVEEIFAKYPDAYIVHTHRHPEKSVPSMATLETLTGGVTSDDVETELVTRLCIELYEYAANKTMQWRLEHADEIAAGKYKILDIHLDEMKADTGAVVDRIIEFADLNVSPEEREAITEFQKNFGIKKHKPYKPKPELFFNVDENGHFMPDESPIMQYYRNFSPVKDANESYLGGSTVSYATPYASAASSASKPEL